MHKKLKEIITKTIQDLLEKKKENGRFKQAMLNPKERGAIIAEIKLASPNENHLGDKDDIEDRVKQYQQAEVDAISVVTEKYFFKGDLSYIQKIKDATSLPILQKDFIIDEYQIYEAKIYQVDAILLIAKILSARSLTAFVNLAKKIGLEPVVEINNDDDFKKALATKTDIIAVNARDLDTFKVDIDKACSLIKKIPRKFIKLGFSGVKGREDVDKYRNAGVDGVLIGTSLMKAKNISEYLEGIVI